MADSEDAKPTRPPTDSRKIMKRKFGQPSFPTLYFRDGVLSIPGYTFEKVSISTRSIGVFADCIPIPGSTMARYRKYDDIGRRQQPEGWFERPRQNCPCSIQRLNVPRERGPHVRRRLHVV